MIDKLATGLNIRRALKRKYKYFDYASKMLGVPRSRVVGWVNCRALPTLEDLVMISEETETKIENLIVIKEQKNE